MLDTSMNALLFAKKLRARQSELKSKYKKDLEKYARDFESWKQALARFLVNDAHKNVAKILRSQFSQNSYRHDDNWKSIILIGYPEPPKRPTDEVIRKIAAALRHIAITWQKTVRLDARELEVYFSDEKDEDE
jgi:hypothetical protein